MYFPKCQTISFECVFKLTHIHTHSSFLAPKTQNISEESESVLHSLLQHISNHLHRFNLRVTEEDWNEHFCSSVDSLDWLFWIPLPEAERNFFSSKWNESHVAHFIWNNKFLLSSPVLLGTVDGWYVVILNLRAPTDTAGLLRSVQGSVCACVCVWVIQKSHLCLRS